VDIGTQGYTSQGILNFLSGVYYVKIMSAGPEEADGSALEQAARAVNKTLGQPAGLPDVLKLFPLEGLEFLSDTYIAKNFLGYGFLHSAFTCRYKAGNGFQLFIIRDDPGEIRHMLSEYLKQAKEVNTGKDGLYVVGDPYNGTVFLGQKDNCIAGVLDTTDETLASGYIRQVLDQIP